VGNGSWVQGLFFAMRSIQGKGSSTGFEFSCMKVGREVGSSETKRKGGLERGKVIPEVPVNLCAQGLREAKGRGRALLTLSGIKTS